MNVVTLKRGDTVVVRHPKSLSSDQAARLSNDVRARANIPTDIDVLVLDGGAEMDVIRGLKPRRRGA